MKSSLILAATVIAAAVVATAAPAVRASKLPCGATNAVRRSWTVFVNGVPCSAGRSLIRRLAALPAGRAFVAAEKKLKRKGAYRYPGRYLGNMTCGLTYIPTIPGSGAVDKLVIFCFDVHSGKGVGGQTVT